MNVEMRKLNPNETYCCSIHEYKKFFKPSELHVSFGIQFSRDEKENSKFYHPKNNSNNIIILKMCVCKERINRFGYKNVSYVNFFIIPKNKFSEILHEKFIMVILPEIRKFYDLHKDDDDILNGGAACLLVGLSNCEYHFYEEAVYRP